MEQVRDERADDKSAKNAAQVRRGNDHLRPTITRDTCKERGGASSGGTESRLGPSSGVEGGGGRTACRCSTESLAIDNELALTV